MKYVDLFIQSLLFVVFLFFSITGAISGRLDDAMFWGFYIAMFLGPWQMLSCLLSIIFTDSFRRQKVIHLIIATAYLTALSMSVLLKAHGPDWIMMLAIVPPALLAVYYYVITCKWAFGRKFNSRFLPHINF